MDKVIKLLRRAETIKTKADQLFVLVYSQLGVESYASDLADNLTCAADDLIHHLDRIKDQSHGENTP